MCDSTSIVFVPAHVSWCLRVSSLSSNCIVVVSESVAETAVSSTAVLAVSGFGHSVTPFRGSVTVPGNQYTPRCFSNLIAFGSVSRAVWGAPLKPGNIAWHPANQVPRCDASPMLSVGKLPSPSSCWTCSLRPFLEQKCDLPTCQCTGSSSAVTSCIVVAVVSFCAV